MLPDQVLLRLNLHQAFHLQLRLYLQHLYLSPYPRTIQDLHYQASP